MLSYNENAQYFLMVGSCEVGNLKFVKIPLKISVKRDDRKKFHLNHKSNNKYLNSLNFSKKSLHEI